VFGREKPFYFLLISAAIGEAIAREVDGSRETMVTAEASRRKLIAKVKKKKRKGDGEDRNVDEEDREDGCGTAGSQTSHRNTQKSRKEDGAAVAGRALAAVAANEWLFLPPMTVHGPRDS